jgi:hypothetical protein
MALLECVVDALSGSADSSSGDGTTRDTTTHSSGGGSGGRVPGGGGGSGGAAMGAGGVGGGASLRDLAARLAAEFLAWSAKHMGAGSSEWPLTVLFWWEGPVCLACSAKQGVQLQWVASPACPPPLRGGLACRCG